MIDTDSLTIAEARKLLEAGTITSSELTQAYLEEIERENGELNAFVEVFNDTLDVAAVADKTTGSGILHGIPMGIKDNILIEGKRASSGSKILKDYVASYDAHVITELKKAGVVFVGRTNMDEFGMGSSTESSHYGPTKNPVDPTRVPGGSSGGSAAAVASGMVPVALGSDTGGSSRQPASFCGIVGFKPTYGTVSRRGLMALASSLDQVGVLAKTCNDANLVYGVISTEDQYDATNIPMSERTTTKKEIKKVGVLRNFVASQPIDASVKEAYEKFLHELEEKGCELVEVDTQLFIDTLSVYYIILPCEASSNLARYDGVRFGLREDYVDLLEQYVYTRASGFGDEVVRRILLGTFSLSSGYKDAYYGKANAKRQEITATFRKLFAEEVDVIVTPTAPTPAFKIGGISSALEMYMQDLFTLPINIAGVPCVSIPYTHDESGLPIGMQIIGDYFSDHAILDFGSKFEKLTPFKQS